MDVFPGGRIAEVVAVRLDRGEDVLASVEKVARDNDIHTGVVISGIGTLDQAQLHHITHTGFPPKDEFVTYEGPIELLSIDGIIADFTPHLHTCISIKDQTYMGHLEPGCRVLYLAEIAIAKLDGIKLTRTKNAETGVNELQAAE
ncbi:MAG TPA: PPC domain-containing DNA-binding protein [Armatimonadota bacterium]|nr:PPC domain-containing DNA-binding protein [Armatimonadota bacterium]